MPFDYAQGDRSIGWHRGGNPIVVVVVYALANFLRNQARVL